MCVLFLSIFIYSCEKTEVVPYEKEAANRMLEYRVTNSAEDLFGVIDDVDNTITVYIPYYISVDFLVPRITLEDGATLIDEDGATINLLEDLEPVNVEDEGYTYTVKDATGATRKYTVDIHIVPFYQPLATGYRTIRDADNNVIADTVSTAEVLVNSQFTIYGNFESSSGKGKLTLINNKTNEVVPDGLQLISVSRNRETHYMTAKVSAEVDSGFYHIEVEHQGRKDTLPTVHLIYKKPLFEWLNKTNTVGDTISLDVRAQSGVNTGITRMYFQFSSLRGYSNDGGTTFRSTQGLTSFPTDLYDEPIEVTIVEQDRNSIKFVFPEIPIGYYSNWINTGTGQNGYTLGQSSLGVYFEFESPEWGKNNQLSIAPSSFEVKPKSN